MGRADKNDADEAEWDEMVWVEWRTATHTGVAQRGAGWPGAGL